VVQNSVRVTEIHKVVRTMRLIDKKNILQENAHWGSINKRGQRRPLPFKINATLFSRTCLCNLLFAELYVRILHPLFLPIAS
jgi:hypothetical protein